MIITCLCLINKQVLLCCDLTHNMGVPKCDFDILVGDRLQSMPDDNFPYEDCND